VWQVQDPPQWVLDQRRTIGHRIRTRRRAIRMSIEKLGQLAGDLDRRTISSIEYGESDPGLTAFLLIARALDVPLADLLRE
jgi:transcriptional regulator with XRE-family HTH domain